MGRRRIFGPTEAVSHDRYTRRIQVSIQVFQGFIQKLDHEEDLSRKKMTQLLVD